MVTHHIGSRLDSAGTFSWKLNLVYRMGEFTIHWSSAPLSLKSFPATALAVLYLPIPEKEVGFLQTNCCDVHRPTDIVLGFLHKPIYIHSMTFPFSF
jgi:hypothetical protein